MRAQVRLSPIRVLSPHPCFIPPPSVFYPLIRVLSPHPSFIPSSVFYPVIRVLYPHPCLSPHLCFIPPSVFYPLIRVLSPHACFIPPSVFYPVIRVLSPYACRPNLVPRAFCFRSAEMALASAGHMTSKSPVFGVFNYDNLCV